MITISCIGEFSIRILRHTCNYAKLWQSPFASDKTPFCLWQDPYKKRGKRIESVEMRFLQHVADFNHLVKQHSANVREYFNTLSLILTK